MLETISCSVQDAARNWFSALQRRVGMPVGSSMGAPDFHIAGILEISEIAAVIHDDKEK